MSQQENLNTSQGARSSRTFLIIAMLIMPLFYAVILFMLGTITTEAYQPPSPLENQLLLWGGITLGLFSVAEVFLTYAFFLPKAWKSYQVEPDASFFQFFLAITLSEAICIYGLIVAMLFWVWTHTVSWAYFLMFAIFGLTHMVYLWLYRFPARFRTIGSRTIFGDREDAIPEQPEVNKVGLLAAACLTLAGVLILMLKF